MSAPPRWLREHLFGRIAIGFLLLVLAIGTLQFYLTLRACGRAALEAEQKLCQSIAAGLAAGIGPLTADGIDRKVLDAAIAPTLAIHPNTRIFLLDEHGAVMAAFGTGPAPIAPVSLHPVNALLTGEAAFPVLGDDPATRGERRPFSAAPLSIAGRPGYLYILLGDAATPSMADMVAESGAARQLLLTLSLGLIAIALTGLVLAHRLARRFRPLLDTARQLEHGRLTRRAPERSRDELGRLAGSVNRLADHLEYSRERARATERFQRELITNISHDLRTPLTAIQGYLETVLIKEENGTLGDAERRRFLGTVFTNVQRLGGLVSELFELSRLDARLDPPGREMVVLAELVQDIVADWRETVDRRGIELHLACADVLPPVAGDMGMLEQLLRRLLDYAVPHTPDGGRIAIALERHETGLRLSVEDSGPSIPSEAIPRMFEPAFRVERSRTHGERAAPGVGLAIARRIAEVHGGAIAIANRPEGGVRLAVTLPVTSEAGA